MVEFKKIGQICDYITYLVEGEKNFKTYIGKPMICYGELITTEYKTKTKKISHNTCETCPLRVIDEWTGEIYCSKDDQAEYDAWEEEFYTGYNYEEFCPRKIYKEWDEEIEEIEKIEHVSHKTYIDETATAVASMTIKRRNTHNALSLTIKSRIENDTEILTVSISAATKEFSSENPDEISDYIKNLINQLGK